MPEIVMPRLSDSMEEGTILTWLKQVGDEVAIGEELVEIETDKANMAYESDVAGTLTEILADEGATLPIGSPIAVVGAADGPKSADIGGFSAHRPEEAPGPAAAPAAPEPADADGPNSAPIGDYSSRRPGEGRERVKASPVA